jgi:pimeloyl-ACP methyl ester carboxylesterase
MAIAFGKVKSSAFVAAFLAFSQGGVFAQSIAPAIFTDPPPDKAHPAMMTVVHIPSHGLLINGVVYQASGAGPHPTIVICHGLPGNEKNLDLAQAARRAGWNAVTFNYRGSWGSPGNFRFAQNLEDGAAVLEFLRTPAQAAALGIDTRRIVLAGHSMGGWVTALTASKDSGLAGAILISAADMGRTGRTREKLVASMADDMESLAGVTPQSMADEIIANSKAFSIGTAAAGLAKIPLLVITSDDGLAPEADVLVKAVEAAGGKNVKTAHFAADHSYSDHRIALENAVLQWLAGLKQDPAFPLRRVSH